MDYSGVIGTQAVGLFSLDYDVNGTKSARSIRSLRILMRVASCLLGMSRFLKATYNLDVTIPSEHMAVSNMPAVQKKTSVMARLG